MMTLSMISQKGGAGKTTLAINLAGAAESLGYRTVVIDLDPQASAKGWHDGRQADTPYVVSAQASRLAEVLATARDHGADLCIIDTAPHSETTALAAARAADLILIPCRPAILDIRAIASSVDIVRLARRSAFVVLNSVPPRGNLADQAEEVIRTYKIEIAPVRIRQRAALVHSLTAGQTVFEYEPKGAAAQEMRALFLRTCNQDDMLTRKQDVKMTRKQANKITSKHPRKEKRTA